MPEQQLITTVGRNRLRAQIQYFSYKEALRVKGPIYEVLIQELYTEGYVHTAQKFEYLINMEKDLIAKRLISVQVCQRKDFLYNLVEKAKNAEKKYRVRDAVNKKLAFTLLHEAIILIDSCGLNFTWLLSEMLDIIMCLISPEDMQIIDLREVLARIFYRYGRHLYLESKQYERATYILREVENFSACQNWTPEFNELNGYTFQTLHEAASKQLAEIYLAMLHDYVDVDIKYALKLAHKAILAMVKGKIRNNRLLLYNTYIEKHECMMKLGRYQLALNDIQKMQKTLAGEEKMEFMLVKCKLFKNKAVCYYQLNDIRSALLKLRQAYTIARKYLYEYEEAVILQLMGKIYSTQPERQVEARETLVSARTIFFRLDDHINRRKIDFLLAKLSATNTLDLLLKKIKSHDFCDMYYLKRWKNRCEPYWDAYYQEIKFTVDDLWSSDSSSVSNSEMEKDTMKDIRYSKGGLMYSIRLSQLPEIDKSPKEPLCLLWEKEYERRNMLWNEYNFRFSLFIK